MASSAHRPASRQLPSPPRVASPDRMACTPIVQRPAQRPEPVLHGANQRARRQTDPAPPASGRSTHEAIPLGQVVGGASSGEAPDEPSRRPAIPGAGQPHDWPPGGGLPVRAVRTFGTIRLAPSIVAALATLRGRDAGAAPASSCSAQYRWNVVLPQGAAVPRRHGPPGRWCRHVRQGVEATERHVCRTPGCGDIVQAERAREEQRGDVRGGGTVGTQARPRHPDKRDRPSAAASAGAAGSSGPRFHCGLICINASRLPCG